MRSCAPLQPRRATTAHGVRLWRSQALPPSPAVCLCPPLQDLFSAKLGRSPITQYFEDYTGPADDAAAAKKFILEKFLHLNKTPSKKIYPHFTCATNTGNIKHVFDAVRYAPTHRPCSRG